MASGPRRVLDVNPTTANAEPANSSKNDKNRDAENASLKQFVQNRGTHAVVASVEVDTTQEPSKGNLEKLFQAVMDDVHNNALEEAEAGEKKTEKKG
ncbi:MAG: hypothetical protein Q9196_004576 [Gyalolechia fulgens]